MASWNIELGKIKKFNRDDYSFRYEELSDTSYYVNEKDNSCISVESYDSQCEQQDMDMAYHEHYEYENNVFDDLYDDPFYEPKNY